MNKEFRPTRILKHLSDSYLQLCAQDRIRKRRQLPSKKIGQPANFEIKLEPLTPKIIPMPPTINETDAMLPKSIVIILDVAVAVSAMSV